LGVTGFPADIAPTGDTRRALLRLFDIPEAEKKKLWRRKFDSAHPNVYGGFFPKEEGTISYVEGFDLGPDVARSVAPSDDPLCEPTPLPPTESLPGWHTSIARYYRGMEQVGVLLMRAVARELGLAEDTFDSAFAGGVSTLRLLHYPARTQADLDKVKRDDVWMMRQGKRYYVCGTAHVDSGLLTLLAQDGVEGLQARDLDGQWIDVPPREGTLVINFGKMLEFWTGGRIKATEHRIIGDGRERFSIPFFYEPRVDAEIAPLPLPGVRAFKPFLYGDFVWEAMTKFLEFHGLEDMRVPLRGKPEVEIATAAPEREFDKVAG
jgi:isopenicillin N synthase-like dioxygenase